jgi:hypothetical protein
MSISVSAPNAAAAVNAADQALHTLQTELGMPTGGLPLSFWETRTGKALQVGVAITAGCLGAASMGIEIWQATKH